MVRQMAPEVRIALDASESSGGAAECDKVGVSLGDATGGGPVKNVIKTVAELAARKPRVGPAVEGGIAGAAEVDEGVLRGEGQDGFRGWGGVGIEPGVAENGVRG
ncbi:hypothetical protein BC936DRAFT_142195 [Jimgerdemannia flammicorona]|uniref:Uncharacterized protein n=1 Tax=Jimgerdemannia flammicorona TaxID=994334 RepID=A0A433A167_9FUNG|nr:hypothetical protein BC936DRAFT_142195 [Jimgerdemannia flammicorona]